MRWINLNTEDHLRAPEFIGSSPAERGTWLCVLGYACERECGGRLVGAAQWKDRQWQQTCGVTIREVRAASRLIAQEGDDIVIWGYPKASEDKVRKNRDAASKGGKALSAKRYAESDESALAARQPRDTVPHGMPHGTPHGSAKREREEKREIEIHPTTSPSSDVARDETAAATTTLEPVSGWDRQAVAAAVLANDPIGVVLACGGTVSDRAGTKAEWLAQAEGLNCLALAETLLSANQAIRLPSGLRKIREARAKWTKAGRRHAAVAMAKDLGLDQLAKQITEGAA